MAETRLTLTLDPQTRGYFWRFLKDFVFPRQAAVTLLIVNVLTRAGLSLWIPWASKAMVDDVLLPVRHDLKLAAWLLLSVAGVLAVNALLNYHFNILLLRLVQNITTRMRGRLADHMLRLPQKYYDASHVGRLLVTALRDPSSVAQQITAGAINALANALILVGGALILFKMSPLLTGVILMVFPLMVVTFFVMKPKMIDINRKQRENWGIVTGMISEKVAGVRLVRSFAAEEFEAQNFGQRIHLHADLNVAGANLNTLYGFLNGLAIHLGYLLVFLVGGLLYLKGQVTLGILVAFYGYFNALFPAVQQICLLPQNLYAAKGSLDKAYRLLDEPFEIASRPDAPKLQGRLETIKFENVSFRYGANLPWVLKDFDLQLTAGQSIGIVGPSGSGKSTLMALLLRFYEPEQGRILVNGRDIREWDLKSLRQTFSLAPQEITLFSGSIRQNLLYDSAAAAELSTENASVEEDARLWQALRLAQAEEFVRGLDRKLESPLGEKGVSLSGGQRQRLSITRAVLAQGQALILDNCTSALDAATERALHAGLVPFLKNRSSFIISHRLLSVAHCDHIIVLDSGRIIESGPPQDLINSTGYFAAVWKQQNSPASTDTI